MIYYLHIWHDEGYKKKFIEEQYLKYTWEAAREEFEFIRDSFSVQYIETHLIDTEAKTCDVIDMQYEIAAERDDYRREQDGESARGDDRRKDAYL